MLLEEIQPDNTEAGTLVYDLPKGAINGATLRVEDPFSDSKAVIDLGITRDRRDHNPEVFRPRRR